MAGQHSQLDKRRSAFGHMFRHFYFYGQKSWPGGTSYQYPGIAKPFTLATIMKISVCLLLVFKCLVGVGQPAELITNATMQDSSRSLLLVSQGGKYEFILGYIEESYWWSNKKDYKVLAYKSDKWEAIQIVSKKKKKGKIKSEILKYSFESDSAKQLITKLTKLGFWTFDRELLNLKTVSVNDSIARTFHIDDGVNYKFEILTKDAYRIIESYEPESYFNKFPQMTIRKEFIDCMQLFIQTWKNKRR
jgi:hypothetical protein